MRSGSVIGLVLALGLTISGCGGDDGQIGDASTPVVSTTPVVTPTPSSGPSSSPTPVAPISCPKIFSQAAAEALAGEKLGKPTTEGVSSLSACRWDSAATGAWVQTISVPASDWARAVPEAIDTALGSDLEFEGRDKLEAARSLIEQGGALDDTAACGIFSTMASALQGQPAGTTKVINYVPSKEAAQGINEQACLGGRYYSVQLISPTLKPGPALEKRVKRALATISG